MQRELPAARLLIMGRGPDEGRLRRLTARLGLEAKVEFRGFQPWDELVRTLHGEVVTRLGTKSSVAGASQFPGAGDPAVSVKGQLPPAGGTRYYQVWYRNTAPFCTGAVFNLTNGVEVDWYP